MALREGLPPIFDRQALLLILGSMPGGRSLAEQRYYAHQNNAFWPIMAACLGFDPGAPYEERTAALREAGIALWDVLASCVRQGSLDTAIESETAAANDLAPLLAACPDLKLIAFNGAAAERWFNRLVRPSLPAAASLPTRRLPSTSPAFAAMRFEEKCRLWRAALVAGRGG